MQGDLYEYMLGKLSTPATKRSVPHAKHIAEMMVELIAPSRTT